MTNRVAAIVLLWFIVMNIITYALFTRSHRRVAFRQSALPSGLLSACAAIGGGPAGYFARRNLRHVPAHVFSITVMAVLAIAQCGFLVLLVIDQLVVDIF